MATSESIPPDGFNSTESMNYAIRMVVPIRREFNRSLDVTRFLHDADYAKEILDLAKFSRDARLTEYAALLELKLYGPRNAEAPAKSATLVTPAGAAGPAAAPAAGAPSSAKGSDKKLTEEEMKAQMLNKYRTGLR